MSGTATSMRAIRALDRTSGLKLEEVPTPQVGPQDVLIKVVAAGITPGILKMAKMGLCHLPTTVGHEGAGVVAAVGTEVPLPDNFTVGSRVRFHATLSCRNCVHCESKRENMCQEYALQGFARFSPTSALYSEYHDGAMAEYVRVPYWTVDSLPDTVSFNVGAKVHDVATAFGALKMADLKTGSTVVLTAATGGMGTLTLRLAHLFPIDKIILVGRSQERLERVQKLTTVKTDIVALESAEKSADEGRLASLLQSLAPKGIDALIDYIPDGDIITQILPALRVGGKFVHMAGNPTPLTGISLLAMMQKCWTTVGTRANTRSDALEILDLLAQGKIQVEDLITHKVSINEVDRMLELLQTRSEPSWLSVVNIGDGDVKENDGASL